MGHPEIDNETPFAFEALFVQDEHNRPVLTPIVKATYSIAPTGALELAEEQRAIDFEGAHEGEPGESSLRAEPDVAFVKLRTDMVLVGHAHAPSADTTQVDVSFEIGPHRKVVRVTGDRRWEKGLVGARITDPEPFERIPLVWERAFGGWDRRHEDPEKHGWEPRNPVGVGFHARGGGLVEGEPLPNLEAPDAPVTRYRSKSRPACFGFVSPDWQPRAGLAGTYDEAWETERSPLLPRDFRREFFNAATEDLIAPGFLTGREPVTVLNATPEGSLRFALPGLEPPTCLVRRRGVRDDATLACSLDTVVVDTDAMELVLLWRACLPLRAGPLDVAAMRIACANAPEIRAAEPQPSNVVPLFGEEAAASTAGG